MPAFFLTFLAVVLAMAGGREAARVARLAEGGVPLAGLLGVALPAAVLACAFAAWLAGALAGLVPARYHEWLVVLALCLAALEALLFGQPRTPIEPTRSTGALAIVLLAGLATDAAALLVLSLALASGAPALAASGGALAMTGVLAVAAIAGTDWRLVPHRILRWASVAALFLFAAIIGFLDVNLPS